MKFYILIALFALACAERDSTLETAISFVQDCNEDYFLCVKEKLLRIVENARTSRSVNLVDGVFIKGEPGKPSTEPLPADPEARDAEVNYRLLDGVVNLFETHSIEVKMNPAEKEELQRSLEEGRGKKKGGGAMGIIGLLAAKILFGKLFIVKLLALKALATAKIALVLAVILFVAWCLKQDHTKTTYEVVPHALHHESHHPHVEHVAHDAGHGGFSGYGSDWSKNSEDAQNLAYSGYTQKH
ncbi:uncharacterized protein LOC101740865 [Bombyx mori]|uniref:Osiris 9 n=1 Tax=Bombyx mori TaxID=7091 RepID=A0A8R1WGX8_BOMMO|nr:uncharacterized protein LOC101740865 [Bombyx mori]